MDPWTKRLPSASGNSLVLRSCITRRPKTRDNKCIISHRHKLLLITFNRTGHSALLLEGNSTLCKWRTQSIPRVIEWKSAHAVHSSVHVGALSYCERESMVRLCCIFSTRTQTSIHLITWRTRYMNSIFVQSKSQEDYDVIIMRGRKVTMNVVWTQKQW